MMFWSRPLFRHGLVMAYLGLLLVLLFYRPVEVGDDWWHLSVGRWIAEHRQVPVEDPFPFAGEKTSWLHTHWLGSWMLYEAYRLGGLEGLKVLRCAYFLFVVGVFCAYFYRKVPFPLLMALAVCLANGLSTRHFLRPELLNFLFLQVLLILLLRYEKSGEHRLLFVLPLLGALWFNLHLGACIYGLTLLGIFLLSSLVSALVSQVYGPAGEVPGHWRRSAALGLALAAFAAAFLFTPLGWDGLVSQWKIFFSPDDSRLFYATLKYIGESQPPRIFRWGIMWFWGLAVLGVVYLFLNKKRSWSRFLLYLVPLVMFLFMGRNSGFFALACAYMVAASAEDMGAAGAVKPAMWKRAAGWGMVLGLLAVMTYLMWGKAVMKVSNNGRLERAISRDLEDYHLAEGVDFLKENGITGPVFNTNILTGGYLLWAGYPDLRPFQDGRSIDFRRTIESQAVQAKPEKFWPLFQKKYPVTVIIGNMDPLSRKFFQRVNSSADWKLVLVKGTMVIFVKKGAHGLPDEADLYQSRLSSQSVSPEDVAVLQDGYRKPRRIPWREWFDPPPFRVDDWETGITLMNLGYGGAGVKMLASGLKNGYVSLGNEVPAVLQRVDRRQLF